MATLAFSRLALSAAVVAFGAVVAAGYMSASNAGLACTQFPLCHGWGAPQNVAQQIHMGHRLLAYLTLALVVGIAIAGSRARAPRVRGLAWTALGLCLLQIALGVATVVSGLEPVLRSVHQANGALLFAALVMLTFTAYASAVAPSVETETGPIEGRAGARAVTQA